MKFSSVFAFIKLSKKQKQKTAQVNPQRENKTHHLSGKSEGSTRTNLDSSTVENTHEPKTSVLIYTAKTVCSITIFLIVFFAISDISPKIDQNVTRFVNPCSGRFCTFRTVARGIEYIFQIICSLIVTYVTSYGWGLCIWVCCAPVVRNFLIMLFYF